MPRLGCCVWTGSVGVAAIISMEAAGGRHRPADPAQQAEDIVGLARLMLALGCVGGHQSLDVLAARFSSEFVRLVHAALPMQEGGAGAISSWRQVLLDPALQNAGVTACTCRLCCPGSLW